MSKNPKPTGHVSGNDLILTRTFRAPIEDVWTSVTRSESTARWFGRWEGEAGVGKTVRLQMVHEKDAPWTNVTIETCDAPTHLVVKTNMAHLEITLREDNGTTEMVFVHHMKDRKLAGDFGPGWEYYLDMLVAARADAPLPVFDDYYPSQKAHYLDGV